MEKRIVTFVFAKTNNTKSIESCADTLEQLLTEANVAGIPSSSWEGCVFKEPNAKIQLTDLDSELPKTAVVRGTETPNIVLYVTQEQKKIKSGSMTRTEMGAKVKEILAQNPSLKAEIGNWTQRKSDDIEAFIKKYGKDTAKVQAEKPAPNQPKAQQKAPSKKEAAPEKSTSPKGVVGVLSSLINKLNASDIISDDEGIELLEGLNTEPKVGCAEGPTFSTVESPYSKEELQAMISGK